MPPTRAARWTTRSGSTSSKSRTASSARRRSYSSLPGAATQGRLGRPHPLQHGPTQEAEAAGDEDALVGEESGHRPTTLGPSSPPARLLLPTAAIGERRRCRSGWRFRSVTSNAPRRRLRDSCRLRQLPANVVVLRVQQRGRGSRRPGCQTPPVRLAVTLEQCWHRVPGTATSVLHTLDGPHRAGRRRRGGGGRSPRRSAAPAPKPPTAPVWELPRLGRSSTSLASTAATSGGSGPSTGPVDALWASAVAAPPGRSPGGHVHDLAPLHHPEHVRAARGFYRQAFELALDRGRPRVLPVAGHPRRLRRPRFDRGRPRHVPWGVEATEVVLEQVAETRSRLDPRW